MKIAIAIIILVGILDILLIQGSAKLEREMKEQRRDNDESRSD